MNDESKTIATITRHQRIVSFLLRELGREFERRADLHDLSKWSLDEFEGFVEINRIAREHPFGSKEYNDSIKNNKVVALHFSRNSHHPEYYGGVDKMPFMDFLEMIVDWTAAHKTYGDTKWENSLAEHTKRFELSNTELEIINVLHDWLMDKF